MKTLNGTDALFLSMETPSWHQHVGGLTLIEPGPEGISYEDVVAMVVDRIRYAPKFTWKLQTLPFDLDRPVWVDDPDFDAASHVHRMAVPAPGGPKEVAEVCGFLVSSQLDRSKPLWEIWYLEGLAGGRVAMFMKYHHSMIDGMSGAALATALLDIEPHPTAALVLLPSEEESHAGGVEVPALVATAAKRLVRTPLNVAKFAVGLGRVGGHLMGSALRKEASWSGLTPPKTTVNGSVGPRRGLAFTSVALADLQAIRKANNVTVNDVVLAICGRVLADYLIEQGEELDRTLSTVMPASRRSEGDESADNQLIAMVASLATDVEDPIERLQVIAESTRRAKAINAGFDKFGIPSTGDVFSPIVLKSMLRLVHDLKIAAKQPFGINTVISNVIGPPLELYTCGGKVLGVYPCSVVMETVATNFTVMSNLDRMDFGLHVDADIVPDPWQLTDRIPAALAELLAASGLGEPTPVTDPFDVEVTA